MNLTIYWGRTAVGILNKVTGKDVGYFSLKNSESPAPSSSKMSIVLKAAEHLAYYVDTLIYEESLKPEDVHETETVENMKELLKEEMFKADELAR